MAGLEGTINTPLGTVQKKTALLIGGAAAIIVGIGYYRYRKTQQANATAAAGASVGTDPATGYLYGSPEDAAALANQAAYQMPSGGSGAGYGSGINNPGQNGTGFASNAQWAQAAIQYLQTQGLIVDSSLLSAALGKYLTGSPVNADETSLINQAIAVEGYPPVSGSNGYPPHLNTGAPSTGGGGSSDTRPGPPYPFGGTPDNPFFSVTPNSHVDGWITSLQSHGVHVLWTQVEGLNPGIWGNIRNTGSGKHEDNIFIHAANYKLPSQASWYK